MTTTRLTRAALLEALDESTGPITESRTLPPSLYTSQEAWEFEREHIFGRDWLCLGRVDQVPEPGDYRAVTIAGEPLLLVRDKDGEIRVLSAVCQHRGMVVAEGNGTCSKFTCPYHHWSYALDGRLLGAPAMERAVGFDKAEHGLPSMPVELWNGFVFASLSPDPEPLAPALAKVDELLKPYRLDQGVTRDGITLTDLQWNWKVMMENFNDPYHASRLHGPLQTFAPSHMNDFLPWDDADGAIARVQHFTHVDGSFNPTQRTLMPVFPHLSEEDRKKGMFILIPPTLALAVVPDEIAYFIISPTGPQSIDIQISYVFDPAALEHPLFEQLLAMAEMGVDNFNREDIYADKMVQVGLQSKFAPRGRYSHQEETLRQLNRWYAKRYREHWPADGA